MLLAKACLPYGQKHSLYIDGDVHSINQIPLSDTLLIAVRRHPQIVLFGYKGTQNCWDLQVIPSFIYLLILRFIRYIRKGITKT
jgi:hypothetical protein